jgi:hypothetical protein
MHIIQWQIVVRVLAALLLILGAGLVAWDLFSSFRVLEPSPGGSHLSIATVVAVRHVPMLGCLAGAVLFVLSFVVRKPQ